MANDITIKLTPRQALILWQIIDGAADAGACADGLYPHEAEALNQIIDKLLSQHSKWKGARVPTPAPNPPPAGLDPKRRVTMTDPTPTPDAPDDDEIVEGRCEHRGCSEAGVGFDEDGKRLCEDCLLDHELEQLDAMFEPRSPWQGFNR